MKNNFRIDSIFHQVGYSFDIPLEIQNEIIHEVDLKLKDGKIHLYGKDDYSLFLIVNTGKEIIEIAVKKSYESKKEMYLEYVIYIPFEPVTKNESRTIMILTYLDYLRQGIEKILTIYKADTKVIEDIFRNINSKVLDNQYC
ncbi:hypothetical protein [Cellulophaga sp. BC115SP]|uniref:hypothetical protein n=1 Tax=Cellulophaga sp. BC115SP TaxID=2683263 RepID=UPI0014122633|nr:hypothetical protein [Cellulophaga sp. BC115SP]NBB32030.1 hypothetical protein [Cellulophaga sp. BC115SP]